MSQEDGQQFDLYDTEYLDSDEDVNYTKFLATKNQPSTSTQKNFMFKPYNKENQLSTSLLSQQSHIKTQLPTTSTQSQLSTDRTLQEHGKILRLILREVKLLRREHKELEANINRSATKTPPRLLEIPVQTKEDFQKFESDIKEDPVKEESLRKTFSNINDQNLEKYIRTSLKLIISNEAASHFSWYGRYENIAVEGYYLMDILKECAMKKFTDAKTTDIINIIKKWFQYSKDRVKKLKPKV